MTFTLDHTAAATAARTARLVTAHGGIETPALMPVPLRQREGGLADVHDDLTALGHLFVEGIAIPNTDDALRLLRVIDALYLNRKAPALHFAAEQPLDAWFTSDQHAGVARAEAEKFERTVSRLHTLCDIRPVALAERSELAGCCA